MTARQRGKNSFVYFVYFVFNNSVLLLVSSFRGSFPATSFQPRPTKGIRVAITVMNRTLASRGRPAM